MPAAISERLGLAYFSVPKSASTSMKMALYEMNSGMPWSREPDRVHPKFPTFPIKGDDFCNVESLWKFTIVRDPISRLLSSYGNRVHFHRDIARAVARDQLGPVKFALRNPGLRRYPSPDRFFLNLRRYQRVSYSIWHHTVSISAFIGSDLSRFDAVYRIEDIGELEVELSRLARRPIKLPREQVEGRKVTLDMLSVRAQKAVLEYTKADYELLQDYFCAPGKGCLSAG